MRTFDGLTAAALADRSLVAELLVWIEARNRTTGAPEPLGLWTGGDARAFQIGAENRTYQGAGALLEVGPRVTDRELSVQTTRLRLHRTDAAVRQALAVYDPRHAPVEIHRALFDPERGTLVAEPHLVLRGMINKVLPTRGAVDGEGYTEVAVVTDARRLTATLPLTYSDDWLQSATGDRGLRYIDISGAVAVKWGEK